MPVTSDARRESTLAYVGLGIGLARRPGDEGAGLNTGSSGAGREDAEVTRLLGAGVGGLDERALGSLASEAEAAGWDGFFLWDHILWDPPGAGLADTTLALATLAIATERVRFGALMTPLPRRRPWKSPARRCRSTGCLAAGSSSA